MTAWFSEVLDRTAHPDDNQPTRLDTQTRLMRCAASDVGWHGTRTEPCWNCGQRGEAVV